MTLKFQNLKMTQFSVENPYCTVLDRLLVYGLIKTVVLRLMLTVLALMVDTLQTFITFAGIS